MRLLSRPPPLWANGEDGGLSAVVTSPFRFSLAVEIAVEEPPDLGSDQEIRPAAVLGHMRQGTARESPDLMLYMPAHRFHPRLELGAE